MSDHPLQEMFHDTFNRAYCATGAPPERMWANVNFKRQLLGELGSWVSDFVWSPAADPLPYYRVLFNGVAIDCIIDTVRPTLVCKADQTA
jgi:hypothetical protein